MRSSGRAMLNKLFPKHPGYKLRKGMIILPFNTRPGGGNTLLWGIGNILLWGAGNTLLWGTVVVVQPGKDLVWSAGNTLLWGAGNTLTWGT